MKEKKYLVFDTETAGNFDAPLIYDIGWTIVNKHGEVCNQFNALVSEVFGNPELMSTAYYLDKLPRYCQLLAQRKIEVLPFDEIRRIYHETLQKFGVDIATAHNASFDIRALSHTEQYCNVSKFLPDDLPVWCTWAMARGFLEKRPVYKAWCEKNGYMTRHKTPKPRTSAEIIYRYITCDTSFIEDHMALSDSFIESQILAYFLKQHKPLRKR